MFGLFVLPGNISLFKIKQEPDELSQACPSFDIFQGCWPVLLP